ncbi:hypothetical protein BIW11_09830 [Tropilaelaps mercedesae]|uniref:Uncharacterized protein n=1 Tax=Tropilaelaps mercedesae TaxID=418985 RepID=A0A1V9XIC6_9ACAR|nr:hypothetical protein BIW11_09830 [Tropilaelaps mercedesae]
MPEYAGTWRPIHRHARTSTRLYTDICFVSTLHKVLRMKSGDISRPLNTTTFRTRFWGRDYRRCKSTQMRRR